MTDTAVQYSTVSEFLFDIEQQMDLPSWHIDGVAVWDYIRAPLHRTIFRKVTQSDKSNDNNEEGIQTYLKGGYLWGRNILFRNPLFSDCTVLSYGSARRKQMDDGYWWDLQFDPVYEATDFDYLHVEKPFRNGHSTPPKTSNLKYIDFIQYSGVICEKLGLVNTSFSKADHERVIEVETRIEDVFDVTVDVESFAKRKVTKARVRKPLFDLLLRRTDPDVALMSVSYGKESFVAACKDQNVPVAELQHGAIDPYHPGYSFPGESTKSLFPDYLFVWGEFWKENIEFPVPDENVIATGYPYLAQQAKQYKSVKPRDQIVIISQPKAGKELSKFAVKLAKDDQISANIVYKLHPKEYGDWEERYPWLVETAIDIIDSDSPPLYQILAESQKLVGAFSTVIYEGFNFGLKTYLLETPGTSTMEWIFDLENVHVVESTNDFTEYYDERVYIDTTGFFTDSAIEKFEQAINMITHS